MKALTVYQPWASLIALGYKAIETRDWGTNYRGPLIIHASKQWRLPERMAAKEASMWLMRHGCLALPVNLPRGAAIAVVDLIDCRQVGPDGELEYSAAERYFGDLRPGRFAWITDHVRRLREPVDCSGMQGLWVASEKVQTAIGQVLPTSFDAIEAHP